MAVGLGSMDMPVPSVAEWEWLNWKFARPVRAGETIYARWTLTQKRAPVGGSATAIVVWRVDVLNAGGALCAEGEVGASVLRNGSSVKVRVDEPAPAAAAAATAGAPAPRRGRRRRRTPAGDGAQKPAEPKLAAEAPVVAPPAAAATGERASSGPRRRRRRRSPGSAQTRNGDAPASAAPSEAPSAPAAVPAAAKPAAANTNTLSRVIRRLRRP